MLIFTPIPIILIILMLSSYSFAGDIERIRTDKIRARADAVQQLVLSLDPTTWTNTAHDPPRTAILMKQRGPNNPNVHRMVDRLLAKEGDFSNMHLSVLTAIADDAWSISRKNEVCKRFKSLTKIELFGGGTENQALMKRTAAILFGEQCPDTKTTVGLTGKQTAAEAKEFFRRYGRTIFSTSLNEHLSATYLALHTAPLSILTTYSKDVETRLIARAILDYYFSELAVNQLENTIAVFNRDKKSIFYDNVQETIPTNNMQWISWLFFGSDQPILKTDNISMSTRASTTKDLSLMLLHTISSYKPNNIILSLGAKLSTGAYSLRQSIGSFDCMKQAYSSRAHQIPAQECNQKAIKREIYGTKKYILGLSHVDDIYRNVSYPTSSHFGAVWRTDSRKNSIRIAHPHFYWRFSPYHDDSSKPWEDEDWAQFSPFRFAWLNKNLYLAIYDLTLDDPYTGWEKESQRNFLYRNRDIHQAIYVYVPESLSLQEIVNDGRRFYQDGDVYVMIRPLDPRSASIETSRHKLYSRLKLPGAITGLFLMMGSIDEYESLADFKSYTDDATFDTSNLAVNKEASYRHKDGTSLLIRAPGLTNEYPVVFRNGIAVNFDATWPELTSPYVSREKMALRVNNGSEGFTIDWSGRLPVYSFGRSSSTSNQ